MDAQNLKAIEKLSGTIELYDYGVNHFNERFYMLTSEPPDTFSINDEIVYILDDTCEAIVFCRESFLLSTHLDGSINFIGQPAGDKILIKDSTYILITLLLGSIKRTHIRLSLA